jgi:hypothetical protein
MLKMEVAMAYFKVLSCYSEGTERNHKKEHVRMVKGYSTEYAMRKFKMFSSLIRSFIHSIGMCRMR